MRGDQAPLARDASQEIVQFGAMTSEAPLGVPDFGGKRGAARLELRHHAAERLFLAAEAIEFLPRGGGGRCRTFEVAQPGSGGVRTLL